MTGITEEQWEDATHGFGPGPIRSGLRYTAPRPEFCRGCGGVIRIQIFRGTDFCSGGCREGFAARVAVLPPSMTGPSEFELV